MTSLPQVGIKVATAEELCEQLYEHQDAQILLNG